jgi:hypothetical protein
MLQSTQGVQTVHEPWEKYVGDMCDGITRELYGTRHCAWRTLTCYDLF